MNEPSALLDRLPEEAVWRLEEACCRFEEAWQAGRRPWLITGWLWFIGAAGPNCNLIASAFPMQDRFIYLSLPGILLAAFTVVVMHRAVVLHDALSISFCAVKFDCGCGAGEVLICRKLVENLGLLILCGWLVSGAGRLGGLRYRLL